jgi:3-oxoacyl-[acyl-carrier-protein] synthase-3
VPGYIAKKYASGEQVHREPAATAARQFADRLRIPASRVFGINWGCSGYSRALSIVRRFIVPSVSLRPEEFILVTTVNRTSQILDFGCKRTAPVFGDFAQATLLAGIDSEKHPVHFELVFATAESRPVDGILFNYHMRENVLVPTPEGGRRFLPRRLVFSIDMMSIGDAAPRAMADATAKALRAAGIRPEDVDFVVPHQAGTGVVKLTAMKLEEIGVRGEVINGLAKEVANVSSSSVPYALKQTRGRLDGTIVCPTAGVGRPGYPTVSQGCVILRATEYHQASVHPSPPRSACDAIEKDIGRLDVAVDQ